MVSAGRGNDPAGAVVEARTKSAAVMLDAIGAKRLGKKTFGLTSIEQAAQLGALMSAPTAALLGRGAGAAGARIVSGQAGDRLPPCPAVDHVDGEWLFVGSEAHAGWARDPGWKWSERRTVWYTADPFQAAGLASQMTPGAREAACAAGVPSETLAALSRAPMGHPWLVCDRANRRILLFGRRDHPAIAAAREDIDELAPGVHSVRRLDAAIGMRAAAEPGLARALGRLAGPSPLIDIEGVSITDLMEIVEDDARGSGGSAKAEKERVPRLSYDRRRKRFTTRATLEAASAGFERQPDGAWTTDEPAKAMPLRPMADLEAEMALQASLARAWAARHPIAPVEMPTPRGGRTYSADNVEAIRFLVARPRAILADDMGVGKTVSVVGAIDVLRPRKVLIVVMAASLTSWFRHLADWLTYEPPIHGVRDYVEGQDGIVVVSDAAVANRPELKRQRWDLVVADEAHRFRNGASQRSSALYGDGGIVAERYIDMTGTPIPNKPQDLFVTLHNKLPEVFPDRGTFMKAYGLAQLSDDTPEHAKRRRFLGKLLYHTVMLRRMKALPVAKTRRTLTLRFEDPVLRAKLAAEVKLYDASMSERRLTVKTRMMADLTAMRRDTAMFKIPYVADLALSYAEKGEPFLIFAHHHPVLEGLHRALSERGLTTILLHGQSTTAKERQREIDLFQAGHGHGVVGGIKSAGTSLTITRARHVIMCELDWEVFELLQAEDRAYRFGQTHDVTVEYVVVEGSSDALIASNNNDKLRIASDIVDAERVA